jgi:hypothetical protein
MAVVVSLPELLDDAVDPARSRTLLGLVPSFRCPNICAWAETVDVSIIPTTRTVESRGRLICSHPQAGMDLICRPGIEAGNPWREPLVNASRPSGRTGGVRLYR